jgi:hypothetical protein
VKFRFIFSPMVVLEGARTGARQMPGAKPHATEEAQGPRRSFTHATGVGCRELMRKRPSLRDYVSH